MSLKISMVFIAMVAVGLYLYGKKKDGRIPATVILLFFCFLGYGRMAIESGPGPWEKTLAQSAGEITKVNGRLADIREKNKSYALTLKGCRIGGEGSQAAAVLIYVPKEEWEAEADRFRIGMKLAVSGCPQEISGARNPGGFDYDKYYRTMGIQYQMFGENIEGIDADYIPYQDYIYGFRRKTIKILEAICEEEDLGIFQAALLGDKAALEDSLRELYQKNGIAHLLAISGLHISMVGLGFYRLLRKAGLSYGHAGGAGVLVIISYGMLTGGSASVARAVLMVMVYMIGEYLGRSYDMLSAAALAGILLLMESPWYLFQAGFQLSFGAVAAIGGVGPWLAKQMKLPKFWQPLLLGAVIQAVTYPMILYHFFQFPLYGIFLNLLVIPLMAYVILSGILGIFLGFFSVDLGIAALGGGHYILWLYRQLCLWCEQIPGANMIIGRPRIWQIGLYYVLMGIVLWRFNGREKRWKGLVHLSCAAIVGFFLLWQIPVHGLETTFLDVGQGDGICLRTEQTVILVDGGSSSDKEVGKQRLEPYLKSKGIGKIDYAIVSHGDEDHTSGLTYLLEEKRGIQIKNLILPWLGKGDPVYETLADAAKTQGGNVYWMKAGEQIEAGKLTLTCVYHGREERKEERNEHSLVLQAEFGNLRILLTGDMSSDGELDMISEGSVSHVQLLKVAHHGSRFSSCDEFLEKTDPDWAIISCGENNRYHHPHKEVIERLQAVESEIITTQESGAIIAWSDGEKMKVKGFYRDLTNH